MRQRRAASIVARASLPILMRLGPELAHDVGLAGLRWLQRLWPAQSYPSAWSLRCFGLEFSHRLGLAAGFDKNGDFLDALMGFSHIELGTVTPRPQPGNPKPRMFRIPEASALINRMGGSTTRASIIWPRSFLAAVIAAFAASVSARISIRRSRMLRATMWRVCARCTRWPFPAHARRARYSAVSRSHGQSARPSAPQGRRHLDRNVA